MKKPLSKFNSILLVSILSCYGVDDYADDYYAPHPDQTSFSPQYSLTAVQPFDDTTFTPQNNMPSDDDYSEEEGEMTPPLVYSQEEYDSDADQDYGRRVYDNMIKSTAQTHKTSELLNHIEANAGKSYAKKLRAQSGEEIISSIETHINLSISASAHLFCEGVNVREILSGNIQGLFETIVNISNDFDIKNQIVGFYIQKQLSFFYTNFITGIDSLDRESWKIKQEKYTSIFEHFLNIINEHKGRHRDGLFLYTENQQSVVLSYIEANLKYLLSKYKDRKGGALFESLNLRESITKSYANEFSRNVMQKFYTLFFDQDGSKTKRDQLIAHYNHLMTESLQEKGEVVSNAPKKFMSAVHYFTGGSSTSATTPNIPTSVPQKKKGWKWWGE